MRCGRRTAPTGTAPPQTLRPGSPRGSGELNRAQAAPGGHSPAPSGPQRPPAANGDGRGSWGRAPRHRRSAGGCSASAAAVLRGRWRCRQRGPWVLSCARAGETRVCSQGGDFQLAGAELASSREGERPEGRRPGPADPVLAVLRARRCRHRAPRARAGRAAPLGQARRKPRGFTLAP